MSGEFKTFQIDQDANKDKGIIARAVGESLGGLCPDFLEEWLPPASYAYSFDREQHLFRKGKNATIVWARLFMGPLSRTDFDMICLEADRLLNSSREEKFLLHLFIPRDAQFPEDAPAEGLLKKLPAGRVKLRLLKYVLLWSWDQCGIALQEMDLKREPVPAPDENREPREKNSEYQFFRQARLNRDELSALMDLSLELKNTKF